MSRSRCVRPALLAAMLFAGSVVATTIAPAHGATRDVDGTWSGLDPSHGAPSALREYAAVLDAAHHRYLIFGGNGLESEAPEQLCNEVWTLSLDTTPGVWSPLAVAGTPPGPRKGVQWGLDPARQRLLVFGGYGEHHAGDPIAYLNDVWQLSLDGTPTWTELFPSGTAPVGRLAGASVYDPLRQRFVGFGGTAGLPTDTWSLDLSGAPAWTPVETGATSPPGSYGMASIYDPVRDRMVIFGGSVSDEYLGAQNDLWELTLADSTVWHKLSAAPITAARTAADTSVDSTAAGLPMPRRTMGAVYDPVRDRMVIFGGWDGLSNATSSFRADTWALPLAGALQWQQLAPTGVVPTGRDAMAAVYDPSADRLVVYGGWSGDTMLGDTEYLTWGEPATAATMVPTASAQPGVASVSWSLHNTTSTYVGVYRRASGQPWTSVGTARRDASGVVSFSDHDVVSGASYDYQVAVASRSGEMFGGVVSVRIPTTGTPLDPPAGLQLTLERMHPNPLTGPFRVSFALVSDAPATLDVLDIGGRSMFSRAVGSLGAGSHTVDLGDSRALPAGVYLVRLAQAGSSRVTRAVVVHGGGATAP